MVHIGIINYRINQWRKNDRTKSYKSVRPQNETWRCQKLVGGYIQEIYTNNSDKQYWVNEEGLMYGLPQNHEASQILGQPVVGNLVVLSGISKLD